MHDFSCTLEFQHALSGRNSPSHKRKAGSLGEVAIDNVTLTAWHLRNGQLFFVFGLNIGLLKILICIGQNYTNNWYRSLIFYSSVCLKINLELWRWIINEMMTKALNGISKEEWNRALKQLFFSVWIWKSWWGNLVMCWQNGYFVWNGDFLWGWKK